MMRSCHDHIYIHSLRKTKSGGKLVVITPKLNAYEPCIITMTWTFSVSTVSPFLLSSRPAAGGIAAFSSVHNVNRSKCAMKHTCTPLLDLHSKPYSKQRDQLPPGTQAGSAGYSCRSDWGHGIRLGGRPLRCWAGYCQCLALALGSGCCKRCSRKRDEKSEGRETHGC
jgi:hypothetical protein